LPAGDSVALPAWPPSPRAPAARPTNHPPTNRAAATLSLCPQHAQQQEEHSKPGVKRLQSGSQRKCSANLVVEPCHEAARGVQVAAAGPGQAPPLILATTLKGTFSWSSICVRSLELASRIRSPSSCACWNCSICLPRSSRRLHTEGARGARCCLGARRDGAKQAITCKYQS
jgi:hypothetical protein